MFFFLKRIEIISNILRFEFILNFFLSKTKIFLRNCSSQKCFLTRSFSPGFSKNVLPLLFIIKKTTFFPIPKSTYLRQKPISSSLTKNECVFPQNLGYQYGMISMKVVLSSMLRRYKFTTDLKLSDLELKFELTMKISNRHMVGMERRVW